MSYWQTPHAALIPFFSGLDKAKLKKTVLWIRMSPECFFQNDTSCLIFIADCTLNVNEALQRVEIITSMYYGDFSLGNVKEALIKAHDTMFLHRHKI